MMDFDYLRAAAYQYYVRNPMTLADLLRATIHADFVDYLLDESEKTLMKDMISIESDIDEAELKQMLLRESGCAETESRQRGEQDSISRCDPAYPWAVEESRSR